MAVSPKWASAAQEQERIRVETETFAYASLKATARGGLRCDPLPGTGGLQHPVRASAPLCAHAQDSLLQRRRHSLRAICRAAILSRNTPTTTCRAVPGTRLS